MDGLRHGRLMSRIRCHRARIYLWIFLFFHTPWQNPRKDVRQASSSSAAMSTHRTAVVHAWIGSGACARAAVACAAPFSPSSVPSGRAPCGRPCASARPVAGPAARAGRVTLTAAFFRVFRLFIRGLSCCARSPCIFSFPCHQPLERRTRRHNPGPRRQEGVLHRPPQRRLALEYR